MSFLKHSRFTYACSLLQIIVYYIRSDDIKKKHFYLYTSLDIINCFNVCKKKLSCDFVYTTNIHKIVVGLQNSEMLTLHNANCIVTLSIVICMCLLVTSKHANKAHIVRLQSESSYICIYIYILSKGCRAKVK
jgi:hypothetical protein